MIAEEAFVWMRSQGVCGGAEDGAGVPPVSRRVRFCGVAQSAEFAQKRLHARPVPVADPVFDLVPEPLDRVESGTVGWQRQQAHVVRTTPVLLPLVEPRAIPDHDVHRIGIAPPDLREELVRPFQADRSGGKELRSPTADLARSPARSSTGRAGPRA